MDNRDHFEIYNDTDIDCPAGGLCMFSGGVTENGIPAVVRPTADSLPNLIVTNFFLPARSTGSGTLDNRVILTLDSAGGPCVDGDEVGSQSGSFLAKKGKGGFVCVGGSNGLQCVATRSTALRVRESDGSPTYFPVGVLEFSGAVVTQPSPGVARATVSAGSLGKGEVNLTFASGSITSDGVYQEFFGTGYDLSLPESGNYLLHYTIGFYGKASVLAGTGTTAARISVDLWDVEGASSLSFAETIAVNVPVVNVNCYGQAHAIVPYTAPTARHVRLRGIRSAETTTTWTLSTQDGVRTLGYVGPF